jgi:hypothetical protein
MVFFERRATLEAYVEPVELSEITVWDSLGRRYELIPVPRSSSIRLGRILAHEPDVLAQVLADYLTRSGVASDVRPTAATCSTLLEKVLSWEWTYEAANPESWSP